MPTTRCGRESTCKASVLERAGGVLEEAVGRSAAAVGVADGQAAASGAELQRSRTGICDIRRSERRAEGAEQARGSDAVYDAAGGVPGAAVEIHGPGRIIVVGSPIAGRNRVETEGLIGFFVNTVVMKGEVRGEESVQRDTEEVREATIGAYAHQEVPFEMLVEQMQPERSLSHSPLFQVAFALHQPPKDVPDVTGLSLSQIGVENQTSKFDLTLSLTETRNTLFGLVEYSTCLFDISTISRMTEHFQTLVESIVTNPRSPDIRD